MKISFLWERWVIFFSSFQNVPLHRKQTCKQAKIEQSEKEKVDHTHFVGWEAICC